MITEYVYYAALAKWSGKTHCGKHMLKMCDIEDKDINEAESAGKALTLFKKRYVKKSGGKRDKKNRSKQSDS